MSLLGSILYTASTVIVGAIFVLVVVLLVLAPGEVIGLRAGWSRRDAKLPASLPYYVDLDGLAMPGKAGIPDQPRAPERYLVYLDGVGKSAPRDTRVAREVIKRLGRVLPGTRFVGHVTPYSPLNRALAAHPRLGRWWRLAAKRFRILIFLRNIAQFLVASDRRYHDTYRSAVAQTVLEHLTASGYVRGSGAPLVLVGYSGGAEAAVSIAPLLQVALQTPPVTIVSIGGVVDARSHLPGVEHLYHFVSRHDWVERLGRMVFPAHWLIARRSGWNSARRAGRISVHRLDEARHFGRRGYLSPVPRFADGRGQLDRTLDAVSAVLTRDQHVAVDGAVDAVAEAEVGRPIAHL
ncbi:hypothetical protein [Flindersiella endophytica]